LSARSSWENRRSLYPIVSSASTQLQKFSPALWTLLIASSMVSKALSIRASISSSVMSCLPS